MVMVYVPRTRARAPLMSGMREAMNRLLDDAICAQAQGEPYTRSSVEYNKLANSLNALLMEDEKKGLDYYQRDMVKVAQKIATLFEKLQGVMLRNVTLEEEMGMPMEETAHVKEEPFCEVDKALPTTSRSAGMETPEVKQEEADLVKEEPLCEVDATPMPYPGTKPPGKPAIQEEKEIKKEEPDDEPMPSTSNAHQMADHDMSQLTCSQLQPNVQRIRAVEPKNATEGFRAVSRVVASSTSVQRISKKPLSYTRPTSRRTWSSIPYSPPIKINTKSAAFPDSASQKAAVSSNTPFAALLRVAARTPVQPHDKPQLKMRSSAYNDGRLIVRCKYCKTTMDERQLARHIAEQHAVTPLSSSVIVTCKYCKTTMDEKHLASHEIIHHQTDQREDGHTSSEIVTCKYCKTSMEERQLASHIADVHAVTTPLSTSVRFDYEQLVLK